MKATSQKRREPHWDASAARQRKERGFLLLLWVLSAASWLVLWQEAPVWVQRCGLAGIVAFFGLVAWWVVRGFSGYESRAGLRIVLRTRPPRVGWWSVALPAAIAVAGTIALALGLQSATLAVVVALAAAAMIALLVGRFLTVFAALSVVGITIGVAALIVVQSVATGFQHEFERRVLGVYAHINVTRANGISEYRRFESYLRTVPGVQGASPFVYYAMALAPADGGVGEQFRQASVLVKGIEPSTAGEVIDLESHLQHGSDEPVAIEELVSQIELRPLPDRPSDRLPAVIASTPDPRGDDWYAEAISRWNDLPPEQRWAASGSLHVSTGDDEWPAEVDPSRRAPPGGDGSEMPTMFIGVTLARELGLEVDDHVMLVDPGATFDTSEPPKFRRYRVAGVFRAGFQEYDSRLVYVNIKELQYFKYRGEDKVSGIDLRLDDAYDAPAVEQVLRRSIGSGEYSILEWQKLNANLFASIRTPKSILTVILSLVSAVAGFNVLAALWTMVVRRNYEVAILMSMGATSSAVARIFQLAGMVLGAVGCIGGLGLGLALCWLVEIYGYSLDPEVYFIERLPVEVSFVQIAAVLALTMGISFVATVPPSLRAARLRPVEGLRYE